MGRLWRPLRCAGVRNLAGDRISVLRLPPCIHLLRVSVGRSLDQGDWVAAGGTRETNAGEGRAEESLVALEESGSLKPAALSFEKEVTHAELVSGRTQFSVQLDLTFWFGFTCLFQSPFFLPSPESHVFRFLPSKPGR